MTVDSRTGASPRPDPQAGRAAARDRRPGVRGHVRPLRRRARRSARRGEPRHQRILPRARGHHEAADRAPRLQYRGRRGRLAGRRPSTATSAIARGARARIGRSSASRPGCGATGRSTISSTACASIIQQPPGEQMAGFYGLDLYNLDASMRAVIDYLDRTIRKPAEIARARYGCLPPWSRRARGLRTHGDERGLCALRSAGDRRCCAI